ncbi:MFS transporter [Peribacillus saganii]|uniref:MFS transporter n=1 Tax=Peribacillus saganii TaxID=2303992 RepID=A0A372LQ42_9BACI|nr:MFS transporter [Peribacillus saganii]RFU69430.1 MFS transporter [Peribacillus saganii]
MKYFLFFVLLAAFMDTFSQLPIMSPLAQELGASSLMTGLIVGTYSFTNMGGNIIAGILIDKIGPRKVLLYGFGATGLILLLYILVQTPLQLLTVRFIHGATGGFLVPAAFTYLGNAAEQENGKGESMSKSGAAIGLAAIIGPAFGGIVSSKMGVGYVFTILSILLILTGILTGLLLPENRASFTDKKDNATGLGQLVPLFTDKNLNMAFIASFSLLFAMGTLAYLLPFRVAELNYPQSFAGILLSFFGCVAIILFILPTHRLVAKISASATMIFGMGIIGLSLCLLSQVEALANMFVTMGIYGIGFALLFPSMSAAVLENTAKENRGKAFGILYAFFSLGVVAGSALLGALDTTIRNGFITGGILIFLFAGIMMYLSLSKKNASF